jgi:23S rRNA (uracil1939-C5)-methyltransferase
VLPFSLGQEGVTVKAGTRLLTLASGVPGDQVRVAPDRDTPGLVRLVALERPSGDRVPAPCAVLDRCGACSLQALDYQNQLQRKSQALARALRGLPGASPEVAPVQGLTPPFGYRTKLLMPAAGAGEILRFGFYRRGTLELVPAEGCPVQHPLALGVLAMARQVLAGNDVAATRPGSQEGWLHALGIRVDPATGRAELTLSGRTARVPRGKRLVGQLNMIPGVSSVALSVNPRRSSFPLEGPPQVLAGSGRMTFSLAGQQLRLAPGTFFQTSAAGAELLVRQVLELLPPRISLLADLYGGAGTLSLAARDRWQRALVVEQSASAVSDLRHNAKAARLQGLTAVQGRVEEHIGAALRRRPEAAILDPPRKGCHPAVLKALIRHPPKTLIYVACGFDAFMRDAETLLKGGGLRLVRAGAVDMFPHTAQLEIVALFQPKVSDTPI